jgi:hypothetical protein
VRCAIEPNRRTTSATSAFESIRLALALPLVSPEIHSTNSRCQIGSPRSKVSMVGGGIILGMLAGLVRSQA